MRGEYQPVKKTNPVSNVVLLGFVSLFTDIGSEMVYPILPLYLTSILGVTPAVIGLIEGIAESLASTVKLFSGMNADKYNNKKQLAFIGYCASFFNKAIILASVTWGGVLFARIVDRFGKGIRVAPRDALVAESSGKNKLGSSYGLHKAMDMLGSAIGVLIAYFLIRAATTDNYRNIIMLSMIPAFIGPLFVILVKEPKVVKKAVPKLEFRWRNLDSRLKAFLIVITIFTLGNSSDAFLILRAHSAGFSARDTILLYFVFNLAASLLAFPLGHMSDRIGRRKTLSYGYLLFGIVYLGMGLLNSRGAFWMLFLLYGAFIALTKGGERALIAEIAPAKIKGSALGLHSGLTGVALLPASVIAGVLWTVVGEAAPFVFGGCLGLCAAVAVYYVLKPNRTVSLPA